MSDMRVMRGFLDSNHWYALLMSTGVVLFYLLMVILTCDIVAYTQASRARECSEMLHGYSKGTLVPLTEDASVEIGACLLQFNQPLVVPGDDG